MYLKKYENNDARECMKTYTKLLENPFIQEWLDDPSDILMYILYDDKDDVKSFATLTMMKKDPLNIHSHPKQLQYIYTFDENRRKGYATHLLHELKKIENTTAFVTDDNVRGLFTKAGYNFHAYDSLYSFPIYRYP